MQVPNRVPTLRQLQLLMALAEYQSLSAVAEQLHISQPSVSIQLKKLADLIDAPIYNINGRKIELTAAGLALLNTAREMFNSLERLQIQLDDLKGLRAGKLRLCVVSTAKYFLPLLLGPFCRRYPLIDVQLTIGNREQVIQRLRENKDDFYLFSHCPDDIEIVKEPFLDNALIVVAPANHELVLQPKISLSRLSHYPFLMREQGSGTRRSIERFCQKHNLQLKERMTIESNEAIKHSVAAGLGLAILSRHTLDYANVPGLVRLNVDEFPITSQWYLVHAKGRNQSLLAQAFHEFMQDEGKSILHKKRADLI